MTLLNILSDDEKLQFETPPLFTGEERKYFQAFTPARRLKKN
jgi:hypothetical protein